MSRAPLTDDLIARLRDMGEHMAEFSDDAVGRLLIEAAEALAVASRPPQERRWTCGASAVGEAALPLACPIHGNACEVETNGPTTSVIACDGQTADAAGRAERQAGIACGTGQTPTGESAHDRPLHPAGAIPRDDLPDLSWERVSAACEQLSQRWGKEADEIDADGDFCCAQTRRHDAGELHDVVRAAEALAAASRPLEKEAELQRVIDVAGEALGTHPDNRSPGCIDALAHWNQQLRAELAAASRPSQEDAKDDIDEIARLADRCRTLEARYDVGGEMPGDLPVTFARCAKFLEHYCAVLRAHGINQTVNAQDRSQVLADFEKISVTAIETFDTEPPSRLSPDELKSFLNAEAKMHAASSRVKDFLLRASESPAAPPPWQPIDIAAMILDEMLAAAQMDGVEFDEEQNGFITQALSDAVQETLNRSALPSPPASAPQQEERHPDGVRELTEEEMTELRADFENWMEQNRPNMTEAVKRLLMPWKYPAIAPAPQHVCGVSGYNGMIDPPCPACEANWKAVQAARAPAPQEEQP